MSIQAMREKMTRAQTAWLSGCVAYSGRNPQGLHLEFVPVDDGRVEAAFACDVVFRGYDGRLHGGVAVTLLDAAMTNCMFACGIAGVTGELKVRFHHPVDVATPACIRAWVERSFHQLHLLRAELVQEETVKASAAGKFMGSVPIPDHERQMEADYDSRTVPG